MISDFGVSDPHVSCVSKSAFLTDKKCLASLKSLVSNASLMLCVDLEVIISDDTRMSEVVKVHVRENDDVRVHVRVNDEVRVNVKVSV